jgi:hypothetical protein
MKWYIWDYAAVRWIELSMIPEHYLSLDEREHITNNAKQVFDPSYRGETHSCGPYLLKKGGS